MSQREWNELVNLSPEELKEWLGSDESAGSGWDKDDGSGETIGHERQDSRLSHSNMLCSGANAGLYSGRKVIAILEKNPKKDPSKYDEEDIQHMRKVVAYIKRHLAQEGKAKQDPQSKSAKSLRNWGVYLNDSLATRRMFANFTSVVLQGMIRRRPDHCGHQIDRRSKLPCAPVSYSIPSNHLIASSTVPPMALFSGLPPLSHTLLYSSQTFAR